ncbi:MAG: hypothetical protein ACI9V1_003379 [Spirosomataceae bacterium]
MNNKNQINLLEADVEMYKSMLNAEVNSKKAFLRKGFIVLGLLTAGYTFSRLLIADDEKQKI